MSNHSTEMDEGMVYQIVSIEPALSLNGARLALLIGPCPAEPEILGPLDFLKASGAEVDISAPDWTARDWLPAARFWTSALKIPSQKKILEAAVADYHGVIIVDGTWNLAVIRINCKLLAFSTTWLSSAEPSEGTFVNGGMDSKLPVLRFSQKKTLIDDQPIAPN